MENRILFLANLLHGNSRGTQPTNRSIEDVYHRRVINHNNWQLLSDEDKQHKRKGALSLSEKWAESPAFIEGKEILNKRDYYSLYIEVYDHIVNLLFQLENLSLNNGEDDMRLLRLECLLRIEKDYINEQFKPRQHLPDYLFKEIRKELQDDLDKFGLSVFNDFVDLYSEMYQLWPQKPDFEYGK